MNPSIFPATCGPGGLDFTNQIYDLCHKCVPPISSSQDLLPPLHSHCSCACDGRVIGMGFHLLRADFPHDITEDINPHDFSILDTLDEASLTQLDALPQTLYDGRSGCDRFPLPLSTEDFQKSLRDRVPKNAKRANNWSYTTFNQWSIWRLSHSQMMFEKAGMPWKEQR